MTVQIELNFLVSERNIINPKGDLLCVEDPFFFRQNERVEGKLHDQSLTLKQPLRILVHWTHENSLWLVTDGCFVDSKTARHPKTTQF